MALKNPRADKRESDSGLSDMTESWLACDMQKKIIKTFLPKSSFIHGTNAPLGVE